MVAVLAVKSLDHAKTRLLTEAPAAGAPLTDAEAGWRTRLSGRRRDLVVAMLCDTVDSVRGAGVEHVVVVTPDDAVLTAAADAGAHGVRESADAPSLNGALMQGTQAARILDPAAGTVLLVQADLPAARADSLREIVAAGARRGLAMVTDHAGDGTALLIRPAAAVEPPRFGPASARAHRLSGADDLDPTGQRWPDVRTDVDTLDDLRAAVRLGVGGHTRAVLGIPDPHTGRPPRTPRPPSVSPGAPMRHD